MSEIALPDPDPYQELLTRLGLKSLARMTHDPLYGLRVAVQNTPSIGTVTTVTTVSTVTALSTWGSYSAYAYSQLISQQAFQQGFRRNLVVS